MKTIYSNDHRGHGGAMELRGAAWVPMAESPERMTVILSALGAAGLPEVIAPQTHSLDAALRLHDPDFVGFLERAYPMWEQRHGPGSAFATVFGMRGLAQKPNLSSIDAMLSAYMFDVYSPFVAGTWMAIRSAYNVTMTGASLMQAGERAVFSLCRPPGHHASSDLAGGYCYLNNAAIAAQSYIDHGAERVAILDFDYHHGNGTQRLFYDRPDVLFASLHGRPEEEYPYLLGFADEIGSGAGEGFNLNLPLPPGTQFDVYGPAIDHAIDRIRAYAPDMLVVSLGVDAFEGDPVGGFRLQTADFQPHWSGDCPAEFTEPFRHGGRLCG